MSSPPRKSSIIRRTCRRMSLGHASPRASSSYEQGNQDGGQASRYQLARANLTRLDHLMQSMSFGPRDAQVLPLENDEIQDPLTPYRGVRYRAELKKWVSEIRPKKDKKKIWLGTYDTDKEAARAFDIGNLCCKKNLPLNFEDSPKLLRKISSKLSPDEARNAIAKLAKEVAKLARVVGITRAEDEEEAREDDIDTLAAQQAHRLVKRKAEEPAQQPINNYNFRSSQVVTYTEVPASDEVAVAVAVDMNNGSLPGSSEDFDFSYMNLPDNLTDIPFLPDTDFHGDTYFWSHELWLSSHNDFASNTSPY